MHIKPGLIRPRGGYEPDFRLEINKLKARA